MLFFNDSCFEAAKRFVQSAVVIDDEAGYLDAETKQSPPVPLITPPAGLTAPLDSEPTAPEESCITDDSEAPEESCITDDSETDHTFDINPVVNGFADLKITCSVQCPNFGQEPRKNEKLKKWAINCIEHADISIIDWRLLREDLHLAEDIIIDLLRSDMEVGGRIRLLCVYTAQPHPKNILSDLKNKIRDELNLSVSGRIEDLAYTIDEKVRIVIFSKSATRGLYTASKVVSFEDLPEILLREFSILVNGLIPCAALHSIAALRECTYTILALMNKSLDGAFCAHRALIPDVDDSIEFILNLISQEISMKIMCDESARNFLDTDSIQSWYDAEVLPENQYASEKEILWEYLKNGKASLFDVQKLWAKVWLRTKEKSQNQLKDKDENDITYSEAEDFIENRSFQEVKDCLPPSEKNTDKFAELFYQGLSETKKACNELSRLTCTAKDESDMRKTTNEKLFLTLGSVVRVRNEETDYILCLQPPCDSIRLKEKTVFLFLQLYKGSAKNTDFVIKLHDGKYQALSIKSPNKKLRFKTFSFTPDKHSGRVLVNKLHRKYKWVAELRPEKAQTISQKVFSNASRLGLEEFELLRRKESQLK